MDGGGIALEYCATEQILSKFLRCLRVFRQKRGKLLAQRANVGPLEERLPGAPHRGTPHARCKGLDAIVKLARLGVTAQRSICPGSVGERIPIAWIQLNGALEVPDRLCPAALTTIDHPGDAIYLGIVWELAPGEFEFGASSCK